MHLTGDFSLFSIDSSSVLATFDGITIDLSNMTGNAGSLLAKGQKSIILKSEATVTVPIRPVSTTTGDSATHLDVSSLAFGGFTFTCFSSTGMSINYAKQTVPCVGERYKKVDNTKLILAGKVTVQCDDGTAEAFMVPFDDGAALSDSNGDYSLGFNGVTYTFPSVIQKAVFKGERDGIQEVEISLEGRSPDSGNFPSAPTGTTGLLQKAMNAYNTAIAFAFQSKSSTVGVNITGNVKFDSVEFTIADEQIVPTNFVFRLYGAVTIAAGT